MKYTPNMLSASRITISIVLCFQSPYSIIFWIFYIICGLTDILDGYLARKLNATSEIGKILDSTGDIAMIIVVLYKIIPTLPLSVCMYLFLSIIVVIKLLSITIGFYKFKKFISLHTYLNKITGFLLFIYLPFYCYDNNLMALNFLGIIAFISAIEELRIFIKSSEEIDRDYKGIFYNL